MSEVPAWHKYNIAENNTTGLVFAPIGVRTREVGIILELPETSVFPAKTVDIKK